MLGAEFEAIGSTEVGFDGLEDIEFRAEIGGVVRRADERAGGNVSETFFQSDAFVICESVWVDVFDDGQVFRRGAEVLTKGEDGDVVGEKVVHCGENLVVALAEAEHDAGFGGNVPFDHPLRLFQDGEGALVLGSGANKWG